MADFATVLAAQLPARLTADLPAELSARQVYYSSNDRVVRSGGNAEIQAANDAIVATGYPGTIHLLPSQIYTIAAQVNIDSVLVDLDGHGARYNSTSAIGTDPNNNVALNVRTNTLNSQSGMGDGFAHATIKNLYMTGPGTTSTSPGAIMLHGTGAVENKVNFENVRVRGFRRAVGIKDLSYFANFEKCHFYLNWIGAEQLDGAWVAYAENCTFQKCIFGNNQHHVVTSKTQFFRFKDNSFDYHGWIDGAQPAYIFAINNGGNIELNNCHLEAFYTSNSWANLDGWSAFKMTDGSMVNTGSRDPALGCWIQGNSNYQHVDVHDVQMFNIGRVSAPTKPDRLIGTPTANMGGFDCPRVRVSGLRPLGDHGSSAHMPTVAGFDRYNSVSGTMEDVHAGLLPKIGLTGTLAISSVTAEDTTGGLTVQVRNWFSGTTKKMMKITGSGKMYITLEPMQRGLSAWVFFLNTRQAVGTITVREALNVAVPKFDGSSFAWVLNPAWALTGATKSVPGAVNAWNAASWKDCANLLGASSQAALQIIEVDFTAVTSGASYMEDFAYTPM